MLKTNKYWGPKCHIQKGPGPRSVENIVKNIDPMLQWLSYCQILLEKLDVACIFFHLFCAINTVSSNL